MTVRLSVAMEQLRLFNLRNQPWFYPKVANSPICYVHPLFLANNFYKYQNVSLKNRNFDFDYGYRTEIDVWLILKRITALR